MTNEKPELEAVPLDLDLVNPKIEIAPQVILTPTNTRDVWRIDSIRWGSWNLEPLGHGDFFRVVAAGPILQPEPAVWERTREAGMAFDWNRAAWILKMARVPNAKAYLQGEVAGKGRSILKGRAPVNSGALRLSSHKSVPTLEFKDPGLENYVIPCWIPQDAVPKEWTEENVSRGIWPKSALDIYEGLAVWAGAETVQAGLWGGQA